MSAKEKFIRFCGAEELDKIERLRFFCSLAMDGQDWIDAELFFDAIEAERDDYKARALFYERTNAEQAAMLNAVIAERDGLLAICANILENGIGFSDVKAMRDAIDRSQAKP